MNNVFDHPVILNTEAFAREFNKYLDGVQITGKDVDVFTELRNVINMIGTGELIVIRRSDKTAILDFMAGPPTEVPAVLLEEV